MIRPCILESHPKSYIGRLTYWSDDHWSADMIWLVSGQMPHTNVLWVWAVKKIDTLVPITSILSYIPTSWSLHFWCDNFENMIYWSKVLLIESDFLFIQTSLCMYVNISYQSGYDQYSIGIGRWPIYWYRLIYRFNR